MANRVKPTLSFMCLGMFIVGADISDELLYESTNAKVVSELCEARPPFSGVLKVNIHYTKFNGSPLAGAEVSVYLSEQLTNEDCTLQTINGGVIHTVLDENGKATVQSPPFTHKNTADIFRVQIAVQPVGDDFDKIPSFDQTKVADYNVTTLDLSKTAPKPLK